MGHHPVKALASDPIVCLLEPVDADPDIIRIDLDGKGAIRGHAHTKEQLFGLGDDIFKIGIPISPNTVRI